VAGADGAGGIDGDVECVFTAQILGLVASGLLAQYIGVRQVFAICAGMVVVLIVIGKMFMEPKGEAA
jgi:hypothetical protein